MRQENGDKNYVESGSLSEMATQSKKNLGNGVEFIQAINEIIEKHM